MAKIFLPKGCGKWSKVREKLGNFKIDTKLSGTPGLFRPFWQKASVCEILELQLN